MIRAYSFFFRLILLAHSKGKILILNRSLSECVFFCISTFFVLIEIIIINKVFYFVSQFTAIHYSLFFWTIICLPFQPSVLRPPAALPSVDFRLLVLPRRIFFRIYTLGKSATTSLTPRHPRPM